MNDDPKHGAEALDVFFRQFGPFDVYSRVLLEVLLEELFEINSFEEKENNG